jgi:hypothetical protein
MLLHVFAGHLNTNTFHPRIGLESSGLTSVRLNDVVVSVASILSRLGVSKFLSVTFVDSLLRENRLNRCFGLLSQALHGVLVLSLYLVILLEALHDMGLL